MSAEAAAGIAQKAMFSGVKEAGGDGGGDGDDESGTAAFMKKTFGE